MKGCTIHSQCYFTRSPDMSTFLEDVRLIRPTEMLAPPRITSMMYDHFQELLGAKTASSPEEREQQRQASHDPRNQGNALREARPSCVGSNLEPASFSAW